MITNPSDRIRLFVLKLLGMLTPEEEKALQKQIRGNSRLQRFYESLEEAGDYATRTEMMEKIDTEKELAAFLQKHQKPVRRLKRVYWQAAAILILSGCGLSVYILNSRKGEMPVSYTSVIFPANHGALLTLSDGSIQTLNGQKTPITETDGSYIFKDSAQLDYTSVATGNKDTTIYNRLAVGRGYEYMLILQDGTKVWLNSESTLEYPVQFLADTRRVKLSGEAYFEVTHDTVHPFIVEVNNKYNVKVLGTRFNIKAYPGDDHSETTLVAGKVAVNDLVLKPSEQAVLYEEKTEVRQVNVNYYLAWHEGWFYFNDERLGQALQQLERWYDVKFVFDSEETGNLRVTGKLKRFENLNVILDMLSTTSGYRFEIREQTVYITPNE